MTDTVPQTAHVSEFIPLSQLKESPTNPRRTFNKEAMAKLVASVLEQGILQPILVRQVNDADHDPAYEIVAGARRFRAAQAAKLAAIHCIVRDLTDKQVLEMQLVENVQRQELHPLDEGNGYRRMHEEHGYSVEDLAQKLGSTKSFVYSRMQLGRLPVNAQTLFFEGAISLSNAQLIARIPDATLQDKAAKDIATGEAGEEMSFRRARDYVQRTYQCDLREAPFPTGDKALLPDVGACGPCPHRTGNQRGLFDDADEKGRADVCTSPKCFERKVRAQWERQKAEVLEKGGEVLEGNPGKEAQHSSAFAEIKEKPYQDGKGRTWKELTKGQDLKPVLVQGFNGEALTRYRAADLVKAAKANKIKCFDRPKARVEPKVSQQQSHEQERVRELGDARLLTAIVEKAERLAAAAAWRMVIRAIAQDSAAEIVDKRRGLRFELEYGPGIAKWRSKETVAAIEKMTVAQLQGLAIEMLASDWPGPIGKELGVDEKKITTAIKAEEKAKAKAEAAAAKVAAKAANKPAIATAVDYLAACLRANPSITYAEASKLAVAAKWKVYPVMFGRAKALLGMVGKLAKKGKGKPMATLALPSGIDPYAGSMKGPGGATRCGD